MGETIEQRIWQAVSAIPPGRVATYGEVAAAAGLPNGARRVGRVLSRLPPGTTLPWHRVINAQGRVSLPAGSAGYREQVARLTEEGVVVRQGRIDRRQFGWLSPTPARG